MAATNRSKAIAKAAKGKTDTAIVPMADDLSAEVKANHPLLTHAQMELVDFLIQTGECRAVAATSLKRSKQWCYSTLRKPHVQAYMREMSLALVSELGVRALSTAGRLLQANSERTRADVAIDLMNRAGIGHSTSQSGPSVNVQINMDSD